MFDNQTKGSLLHPTKNVQTNSPIPQKGGVKTIKI